MLQAIHWSENGSHQPEMTKLLSSLHASLDKGVELSAAMARHPDFFDEYYINMVRVGESAGKLDEVFARLYTQLDFAAACVKKSRRCCATPRLCSAPSSSPP